MTNRPKDGAEPFQWREYADELEATIAELENVEHHQWTLALVEAAPMAAIRAIISRDATIAKQQALMQRVVDERNSGEALIQVHEKDKAWFMRVVKRIDDMAKHIDKC